MNTTTLDSTTPNSGLSSNTEDSLHKASTGAHAAVNSIASAADVAARTVTPAIDQIAAMAHQALDKAAGAVAPTADWLAEYSESLNANRKKLIADSCNYVSANPLKSVGVALAAGFLLSRILR